VCTLPMVSDASLLLNLGCAACTIRSPKWPTNLLSDWTMYLGRSWDRFATMAATQATTDSTAHPVTRGSVRLDSGIYATTFSWALVHLDEAVIRPITTHRVRRMITHTGPAALSIA
jgi:hypothetical protein